MRAFCHILFGMLILTGVAAPARAHRQHSFGNVFDIVSLREACELAKKEFTLVFVYVTKPQGKACSYLEQPTWREWQKLDLLIRETVLVKVDGKWGGDQLRRYELKELPAVLLLNPDGTQRRRLSADLSLEQLMRELVADLSGPDSIVRVRQALEKNGGEDPLLRERLAETLARHGALDAALKEYLWCLDIGLQNNIRYAAARRRIVLKGFTALAERFPPAREALTNRQSAIEKMLRGAPEDVNLAGNLMELNACLNDVERTVVLFDQLPEGSKARRILFEGALHKLVEAKRYSEVVAKPDPKRAFRYDRDLAVRDPMRAFRREVNLARMRRARKDESPGAHLERGTRAYAIARGTALIEALAGLRRTEEARALLEQVLKFDDTPPTLALLRHHLQRAGNKELIHHLESKPAEPQDDDTP